MKILARRRLSIVDGWYRAQKGDAEKPKRECSREKGNIVTLKWSQTCRGNPFLPEFKKIGQGGYSFQVVLPFKEDIFSAKYSLNLSCSIAWLFTWREILEKNVRCIVLIIF